MTKRKIFLFLSTLAILIAAQLAFGSGHSDLKVKMRSLAAALNNLLPDISSKNVFDRPGSETKKRMAQLSQALDAVEPDLISHEKMRSQFSADPIYAAVLRAFRDDVRSAISAYNLGRVDYSRALLRSSVSYCISCHTRHENTSEFSFPLFAETFKQLTLSEQMKMMAAARRFDEALDLFESSADFESMKQTDNFELEGATRLAIAILVRVKQSPTPGIELIQKIKNKTQRSKEFYKELDGWLSAFQEWQKEKPRSLKAENDYILEMNELMKRAGKRQDFPFDQKADVDYLRATALMHAFLEKFPRSKEIGRVLLNLGKAYEVLQDLGFWSLHENYYEACIRASPRSPEAKECFSRFEDSVTMGYTGSAGTHVPTEVKKKISELKKLAFPQL